MRSAKILFLVLAHLLTQSAAVQSPSQDAHSPGLCDMNPKYLNSLYEAHTISLPVDHFHNDSRYAPHSDAYFENRYWFDDTYFAPGGPVIVLNAGESSGLYALQYMQIGLLHELSKATKGIAVVLEHRYYGISFPVNVSHIFTKEDYRFLSVEQAMADEAFFAQNVQFGGKENLNLTAPNTPWFAIGCSYPGGLTAFERIQYPDTFWGAISSSGVTAPKADYWEYDAAVRQYSPQACVEPVGKIINIGDRILSGGNQTQIRQLKGLFGAHASDPNEDFATEFLYFSYTLQIHNWFKCYGKLDDAEFCTVMSSSEIQFPKLAASKRKQVEEIISNGGWENETNTLTTSFINFIGLTMYSVIPGGNTTTDFGAENLVDALGKPGIANSMSWLYQQCTEMGWFQTSGGPQYPLPIVSSFDTLDYELEQCKEYLNLTGLPDTELLAKYGEHNVSYPRLMIVGGEDDPWRPATPLATLDVPTRLNTTSTPDEPWFLIKGATHCWDFDGILSNETSYGTPTAAVKEAHEMEIATFQRWLKEWHQQHPSYQVENRPS